ncbi:LuxR C-terminal-related transcriptional regulator [Streptomyces sp. NPDC005438]|uniref:LuxR C-terminal-related transcriptional regulator n=1 Tax=Streptomyces sp. NPDC005438 TaxID=3156880 RepID=UPI0033AC66A5
MALDELARLSLVRTSGQYPGELLLVNPEVSLVSLLAHQEDELARRQQQINHGRLAISELVAEYADTVQNRRRVEIEELRGVEMVRAVLQDLTHGCVSEVMELSTGGGQSRATIEASRPLDQSAVDRGVTLRSVYQSSAGNHPDTVEYLNWLTRLGASVRLAPSLPLRMVIFDREAAVVPSNPDDTAAGALVLHGAGLVSALCALFEHVWEGASLFGEAPAPDRETGLTSQARAVIGLLAQGYTDEVVARKLGISVRTSRRITAELMTQLGARSRFQAGVIAGERGWLRGARDAAVL